MPYIFGMAKTIKKCHGGSARNLELDFLRLIYFGEKYKGSKAFLLVIVDNKNKDDFRTIDAWKKKYNNNKVLVKILSINDLSSGEKRAMKSEKKNNSEFIDSIATIGRDVGEEKLFKYIKKTLKTDFKKLKDVNKGKFDIQWDFVKSI